MTVAACSQSELTTHESASSCAADLFAGFATPQHAFATYAAALNEQDYCRAANTYAREQRPELATSAFTALVITAGTTEGPKQPAFRARFRQLCTKYGLGCDAEPRVTELVAELRAGESIQSLEPKLARVVQRAPEDVFRDVMQTLADVDPNAIGRLSPTLKDLTVQGDRASALAERAGKRGTTTILIKGERGWMLALH